MNKVRFARWQRNRMLYVSNSVRFHLYPLSNGKHGYGAHLARCKFMVCVVIEFHFIPEWVCQVVTV